MPYILYYGQGEKKSAFSNLQSRNINFPKTLAFFQNMVYNKSTI